MRRTLSPDAACAVSAPLPVTQQRCTVDAMRDARLCRLRREFDSLQQGFRSLDHRCFLAAYVTADPKPVIAGEPLQRLFHAAAPVRAHALNASCVSGECCPRAWSNALPVARLQFQPQAGSRGYGDARGVGRPQPPCPPSRWPCRDARSPPGRRSGAAPGRRPCPTIRSPRRSGRLA